MSTYVNGRKINSVKVRQGLTYRRYIRMEQMARLEATGQFSTTQLAAHFNLAVPTIHIMRAQPEYARMRDSFATGIVDTIQDSARLLVENQLQELQDMVPQSLRVLRDTLVRGVAMSATTQDRKMAVDVAREVLDREGTFAKVSKSEIKVNEIPNISEQQELHDDLLSLFQSADAAKNGDSSAAKVLDSFVSAAGDKTSQAQMAELIKLEDFNPTGKPVQ